MGVKTWISEFFPDDPPSEMTKVRALEHSIQKWKGLREENLRRHEVYVSDKRNVADDSEERFPISCDTCALCQKYFRDDEKVVEEVELNDIYVEDEIPRCNRCPLKVFLGKPCDVRGPYTEWRDGKGPESMISTLEETLKVELQKDKESI